MRKRSIHRLAHPPVLLTHSFWAVFGNGLGSGLLLLAGILVARFLGKDLYGEYGLVKTTLFYVASFSAFGLGITSTKYISQAIASCKNNIRAIIRDCYRITALFSSAMAVLLLLASQFIADVVGESHLGVSLRFLAVIIVFKALATAQSGILAGLKEFRLNAINNMASGLIMVATCVPLTSTYGLDGAFVALLLSQFAAFALNFFFIRKRLRAFPLGETQSLIPEIVKFSTPVALQESSIWVFNWLAVVILSRFSSTGELSLYTAAAQWCSIIVFAPSLMSNVVLSYIAGNQDRHEERTKLFKKLLGVNLFCVIIPLALVFTLAGVISQFYGSSFTRLDYVLRILIFSCLFECCSYVFKSEYIAQNRVWEYFVLRAIRDVLMLALTYYALWQNNGKDGAALISYAVVASSAFFFLSLSLRYNHGR